jgi:flagellar basal-body rod protein FlgC
MRILDVLKVASSALKAQRTRMEVIASNLANIHTTRTEKGGPYRKKEVVFKSERVGSFGDRLEEAVRGVKVEEIRESRKPFEQVYDPTHPDADALGYVWLPNVNLVEEMTDMILAARSYEANLNVINVTKEMFLKSLEIVR